MLRIRYCSPGDGRFRLGFLFNILAIEDGVRVDIRQLTASANGVAVPPSRGMMRLVTGLHIQARKGKITF
jgi:hypothetical protein